MTHQKNSPISRRTLLRSGGAVVASGVVLAACGGSTGNPVTRIGEQPESEPLSDAKVDDVVLLRTAQSVEKMVADILSDSRITSVLSGEKATLVAAFAVAHQRHVSNIAPLVTSRGGEPVNEANAKLMTAYGNTVLDLIGESKEQDDALTAVLGLETLVAATYQYSLSLTVEPALRADMMRLGAQSSRHAAVLAQLKNPGTKGFAPGTDEEGNPTVATLPTAFGALNSVQIAIGPPNEVGLRTNVLMDTPSLNSLLYVS
ncbi:unannotated protein [freshwater metagenome]|uniref:Unannotated protein n=1 Tax=freshwater metagenome TaxID=449393 RepID=A0A6J6DD50_9ZZZZ|nr:hypothetical protein [Actinomycetota bacterium]MTA93622.1 hypothetical protein [Actinomycetota bacterium]